MREKPGYSAVHPAKPPLTKIPKSMQNNLHIAQNRYTNIQKTLNKTYLNRHGEKMSSYSISKEVDLSFETAISKISEELKKNGFGVLSRIDMHKKFKEKLNLNFKKYAILGACNPPNAYSAINIEDEIGLLLPCNIVVFEKGNGSVVSIIRPTVAMQIAENSNLTTIAQQIEEKLKTTLSNI
jgi:uncharacterized protein (DUF302 family)